MKGERMNTTAKSSWWLLGFLYSPYELAGLLCAFCMEPPHSMRMCHLDAFPTGGWKETSFSTLNTWALVADFPALNRLFHAEEEDMRFCVHPPPFPPPPPPPPPLSPLLLLLLLLLILLWNWRRRRLTGVGLRPAQFALLAPPPLHSSWQIGISMNELVESTQSRKNLSDIQIHPKKWMEFDWSDTSNNKRERIRRRISSRRRN